MMFGSYGNPDHADAVTVIHAALDAGINFVDTADIYSAGESEEIVGKALANGRRDEVILATKFHLPMGEGPNDRGNSRRWIFRAVEASLRRLRTDWIDLYQVHRPDPATDVEETLSALTDLQRAGTIRYFGSSTFPAYQLVEAQWAAERRALGRFTTEQPPYSILARGIEADVLPVCVRYGIGVIPWSPLAGGLLSGRYRRGEELPLSRRADRFPVRYDVGRPENDRKLEAIFALDELASDVGMPLVELALGFVLAHPAISSAIVGPRTMEHLDGVLPALELSLGADLLDRIDGIVPPGETLNRADAGYVPPSLAEPALRRR
jgi:aryl-alcohol dehydrogenase-like predicted oxidoreductase